MNDAEDILCASADEDTSEDYLSKWPATSNINTTTGEDRDKVDMEYKRKEVEY